MSRNFDDPFTTYPSDLDSPASFAYEILPNGGRETGSPHDSDGILTTSIRALYIGQTGNVYCRPVGNGDTTYIAANVLFVSVPAGTVLPVRMAAVWNTHPTDIHGNTTARSLVGLY